MEVCKLWNIIGKARQDIWKVLYLNCWPNTTFPKHMTPDEMNRFNEKWSLWFRQKTIIERKNRKNIINIGTINGWVVQTCSYIGCTTILFNEKASISHGKFHDDKLF